MNKLSPYTAKVGYFTGPLKYRVCIWDENAERHIITKVWRKKTAMKLVAFINVVLALVKKDHEALRANGVNP